MADSSTKGTGSTALAADVTPTPTARTTSVAATTAGAPSALSNDTAPEPTVASASAEDLAVAAASIEKRPPLSELKGIRYTGPADFRVFTETDLANLGIEETAHEGDLTWSAANNFFIPIRHFNAATVDALLSVEGFTAE